MECIFSKDGVDSINGTFKKKYDWSNMGICIFVAFCGALELDLDDRKTRKFVQRVYKRAYTNRGGGQSWPVKYIPWFNEILKNLLI